MLTEEKFEQLDMEMEEKFGENPTSFAYMKMSYLQEFRPDEWRDMLEQGTAESYLNKIQKEYSDRKKELLAAEMKRHPEIEAEPDMMTRLQMKNRIRSIVQERLNEEIAPCYN